MTCAHCEILEQQLRELRGETIPVPLDWDLSPKEEVLMRFMLKREVVSRSAAMTVLYGYGDSMPEDRVIDQMISRIRKRVKGIKIRPSRARLCRQVMIFLHL